MVLQYWGYGFRARRCAAPRNDNGIVAGADSMQALRFLFSPTGRLGPQAFAVAVIAAYAAGAASQWLTVPGVVARNGLWPFALAQAVLIWVWFALHAKRLRDANRSTGLAAGASLLYALSIVLLLIVATAFFTASPSATTDTHATGALGLILLLSIVTTLAGSSSYDLGWFAVVILMLLALLPIVVAVAVTLWAATGASVNEPTA
jgi:uncharacterized membrane protein YhaH (DUF805 family)